jgi:DNA-binding protein
MSTQRENNNTIFVGKKPVMDYVIACLTLFQNGTGDITIKARGRAISKAVDAAQMITKRFVPGATVKSVELATEKVKNLESGVMSDVSSMEIRLSSSSTA